MTISIALPDNIEAQLRQQADMERRSVEELALEILSSSLEARGSFPTLEEVVEKIRSTPQNPRSIRRASGSLADALRHAQQDPEFDLVEWNKQWTAVEAEIKAITRSNDTAEGRG